MTRNITEWLEGLGLGKYASMFAENEIDFGALPHLTEDDLREIGIALGARRKLLAAIAELGQPADVASLPADEPLGERRQVTVLFADLSNFTGLSSELGAEANGASFRALSKIVSRRAADRRCWCAARQALAEPTDRRVRVRGT